MIDILWTNIISLFLLFLFLYKIFSLINKYFIIYAINTMLTKTDLSIFKILSINQYLIGIVNLTSLLTPWQIFMPWFHSYFILLNLWTLWVSRIFFSNWQETFSICILSVFIGCWCSKLNFLVFCLIELPYWEVIIDCLHAIKLQYNSPWNLSKECLIKFN